MTVLIEAYTAEMLMRLQASELQRINREAWKWIVPKPPKSRLQTRISGWFRLHPVTTDSCCTACC